jgi:hypothetical protein
MFETVILSILLLRNRSPRLSTISPELPKAPTRIPDSTLDSYVSWPFVSARGRNQCLSHMHFVNIDLPLPISSSLPDFVRK